MQLFFSTQFNEADRLRRSGLSSLSQPTGLTALAAASTLAPARSNRAAASVAWVFVIFSLVYQQGVMAVPVRLQPPVSHSAAMQPTPGKADTPKRHMALLSTHSKNHSEPSKASPKASHANTPPEVQNILDSSTNVEPDFLQLGSAIEELTAPVPDNSTVVYVPRALLQEKMVAMYQKELGNSSSEHALLTEHALSHALSGHKQYQERNASIWPWIRLGSVIRKSNTTREAVLNDPFSKEPTGIVKNRADTDGNDDFDKEERVALLKSVKRSERPGALISFFTAFRRHFVTDHHLMALPLGVAALTITAFVGLWLLFTLRFGVPSGVRAQIETLQVSSGQEIQNLFQTKERYDCCHFQPLSPGLVLRMQGKVVPGRQGKLVAPLSKRDCVHFSASASAKRHDGIHALPVAYHSSCVDFVITMLDAPHIQIAIRGQEVALFDTTNGKTEDQRCFSESPDHWQDFVLTHRAPGADGMSSASLRSESASLEFREVALVAGTVVTCVGEVRRGYDGMLELFPCEEVSAQHSASMQPGIFSERWRTSWERLEDKALKAPEKVLISDDKRLLKKPGWGCLNRHSIKRGDARGEDA